MTLSAIEKMIHRQTGLTFDTHRKSVLKDKVARHMAMTGMDDLEQYYGTICTRQRLFDDLVDQLTINETFFFREPAYLDLLCHRMIPELLAGKKTQEKLSILSAGCSTGEEPCSIAMAVEQAHGQAVLSRLDIFGVDIDNTALATARTGIYGKWKLRQLPPALVARYFKALPGDRYAIDHDILNKIIYCSANLLQGTLTATVKTADIIFYRNVSIYFDKATRMKVLSHLEEILRPGGFLVLGTAETLSHDKNALTLLEMDGRFFYQKRADKSHAVSMTGAAMSMEKSSDVRGFSRKSHDIKATAPSPVSRVAASPGETGQSIYKTALDLARQKKFDQALALLDPLLKKNNDIMVKVMILRAGLFIQKGDLKTAREICQGCINDDVTCAPACLLLGMIASMELKYEESLKRFREVTCIEPGNWLAHFLMFQAYQTLDKRKDAIRQAAVVVRLLEKTPDHDHGLDYFPLSFSREQILNLCRRNVSLTTGI